MPGAPLALDIDTALLQQALFHLALGEGARFTLHLPVLRPAGRGA